MKVQAMLILSHQGGLNTKSWEKVSLLALIRRQGHLA
jgi:hypothetical protein